jgi:hypothetical protein
MHLNRATVIGRVTSAGPKLRVQDAWLAANRENLELSRRAPQDPALLDMRPC